MMKSLTSVLCLLSCLVAVVMSQSGDNVNGDILYPNGVYNPAAAVDSWRKFLEKVGQSVSKEGLPFHQQMIGAVGVLGNALIEDNDANTIKLLKMSNGLAVQLTPHIQNEKVRRVHLGIIDGIKKLSDDAAANELGPDDVHNFIRKACKSMTTL